MAYRDQVEYIDRMNPLRVDIAAGDFLRVVQLIDSALPTLDDAKHRIVWQAESKALFDKRLREADLLIESLRHGYERAWQALDDYSAAQTVAIRLAAEGRAAESALGNLIADIVRTQSPAVRMSAPMRQWNDLRSVTGVMDLLAELGQRRAVEAVRGEAERLWHQASDLYERALRTETHARELALAALRSARDLVADFASDSAAARRVIKGVPELARLTLQAAQGEYARRPGNGVLALYQVDEGEARMYPDGTLGVLAGLAGVTPERLTVAEARMLDALPSWDMLKFREIDHESTEAANRAFPTRDRDDGHNDAFRHIYWNARLTQEFGEDWAARYTTLHESMPENRAAREAMDLYNNELGRSIGAANLDASPQEVERMVREAIDEGRAAVIDGRRNLAYSDQVLPGETGEAVDYQMLGNPLPGRF